MLAYLSDSIGASPAQTRWNYCNVLRDDGMSYGDYVEQLTYLLFLKMADDLSKSQGRWRAYDYEEFINRYKAGLDIFWLKDKSLEDSENLPDPGILVQEIVEDLEAALDQFREIAEDLEEKNNSCCKEAR